MIDFIYRRIAHDLETRIRSGDLRPGERLPSIRAMREMSGAGVNTVYRAYLELEAAGYIEAAPKSGFFIRAQGVEGMKRPGVPAAPTVRDDVKVSEITGKVVADSLNPDLVPLGASTLSCELLPEKTLERMLKEAVRRGTGRILRYENSTGSVELKRRLITHLYPPGTGIGEDDLIVTNGCTEAVTLALLAVTSPGDLVAVESPTHFGFLQALKELGLRVAELPTDPRNGLPVDVLERTLASYPVKACLLTPSFHNPTGSLMPEDAREAAVRLLNARDIPVIEDEIYADLYFGATRPPSLRTWDEKGLVIGCSSVSKCLSPGFRTGWIITSPRFKDRIGRLKACLSLTSPTLQQLALADFLSGNHMDRHLRALRTGLKAQVMKTAFAVREAFPAGSGFAVPEGGNMLWVELPEGIDGTGLYRDALAEGISIVPGAAFTTTSAFDGFIRISCTSPFSDRIRDAVWKLGELAGRKKP